MTIEALHSLLLRPQTLAAAHGPIEYRETHVSRLYFTPELVYKFKKPVDFGFLDFTSLEKRRFFCQEELRLNRRFCPDTYLKVVTLRQQADGIRIAESGDILEYAVQMRRLPQERMLDHLIASGDFSLDAQMDRLALRIADLHRGSEICRSPDGRGSLRDIRENWEENFRQTAPFAGKTLTEPAQRICASYVKEFLRENEDLLHRRDRQGWIRDGHGDLHAEHVCLTEPIRIYDCIEFNRRFRVADVAADLAFLLMDLDYRNRRDLSGRLRERYLAAMEDTAEVPFLLPFYQIYRAWVRGKVESFLSADREADAGLREPAARRARRYFALALGYLCPPALILICGLTGVGKSHLAERLTTALGAEWVRSDLLRREIHGRGESERTGDAFGQGIYTPEAGRRTYDLLLQRTLSAVTEGRPAIADATFASRAERERFRRAAGEAGVPVYLLHLECDRELALQRLVRRQEEGKDPSEGRPEIYERQARVFEAPAADELAIRVDTGGEVDYNALHVLTAMAEPHGIPV